ncbi:hypothetical protein PAHAL_4G069600 [Panicum hallii]|uniref:RING-type domain-containing protein n=1 Tax=Panicum hallii TaxID=206008 RepID=A0A2T8JC11_9POAL|nr:hypothetical protein PAHAL_4G069600 [Panicum hallii]
MGGAVLETRTDVDIDDPDDASPIVRALGPDWRWKFMLIIAGALLATLLLIWLAKRAGRGGGVAAGGRPSHSPRSRCARCARTTSSRVRTRSRCPCGHPYHRLCITLAVDHDPRCPVCRAPVSPADTAA